MLCVEVIAFSDFCALLLSLSGSVVIVVALLVMWLLSCFVSQVISMPVVH